MSKYTFSSAERFAIYVTHGERCYMCSTPVDLKSMQVDHLIPEDLLAKREELASVIHSFALASDFNLNTFSNWMPSCAPCNRKKLATIFNPSPIIQLVLQQAAAKSEQAKALSEKTVSKRRITNALNVLKMADEAGELSEELKQELQPLIEYQIQERLPELQDQPIQLMPLYEVVSEANGIKIVKGRFGVGARPAGNNVHSSFNCPGCGTSGAWSGARCVVCGEMSDD
jgi:hypothetical protein